MAMAVETFYAGREFGWQQVGCYTETAAGGTGVVQFCLDLGIFGVYAYAA